MPEKTRALGGKQPSDSVSDTVTHVSRRRATHTLPEGSEAKVLSLHPTAWSGSPGSLGTVGVPCVAVSTDPVHAVVASVPSWGFSRKVSRATGQFLGGFGGGLVLGSSGQHVQRHAKSRELSAQKKSKHRHPHQGLVAYEAGPQEAPTGFPMSLLLCTSEHPRPWGAAGTARGQPGGGDLGPGCVH